MKRAVILSVLFIWTTSTAAQTTYDEGAPVQDISSGISYQRGPGSTNTFNWTYPYGTKLTVSDGSCCRNFEIGVSGYQSIYGDLIFRYWDPNENSWKPWRKIVLANENGLVDLKGDLITPNPINGNANVNLSWYNNTARIRVGGSGEGAYNGLDIQSVGNISLFRILHSGKVGIGTTTPDAKLTVKGNIHAEEIKVDLTVPAPDYVFKEGYDLKSLEEVQNHIKKHGHLPNIPSAKEFEANGIQLGEMDMKLLEKIEELVLYILNQEKQLKKEREHNQKQENRIARLERLLLVNDK